MIAMQAMTRNVVCVRGNDSLQVARDLMREWEIRHLPVVENRRLHGVISDRDLLPYLTSGGASSAKILVREAMSRRLITCSPSDSISHIAGLMIDNKIDCIPVVEDDKELVGLITSMDLIDLLRERETLDVSRVIPWGYRVQTPETGYSGPG